MHILIQQTSIDTEVQSSEKCHGDLQLFFRLDIILNLHNTCKVFEVSHKNAEPQNLSNPDLHFMTFQVNGPGTIIYNIQHNIFITFLSAEEHKSPSLACPRF